MRRTASWGSRDAFTDGHISHHADPPAVPAGRRTLAATTRAHRHKRHYTPARSANYQAMQQQQDPSALHKTPSMNGPKHVAENLLQRQFPSEEALRRMSAPAAPPSTFISLKLTLLKPLAGARPGRLSALLLPSVLFAWHHCWFHVGVGKMHLHHLLVCCVLHH